uniref:Putative tyrosine phosphatase protein n=1 Tax=Toxoneuron nigriceps polydnavirus TaxID=191766 RepID=Q5W3K6_9VIRU|nr:putative tyrosine phosphatase protein [Toxoneuron nigriceps polydnavirus]
MALFLQLRTLTTEELIKRSARKDFQAAIEQEYQTLTALKDINTYYHFHLPENQDKNRYQDVPCADSSRVLLDKDETSYIHANYVFDFNHNEERMGFIATQAPLRTTVEDFWRMVWSENTKMIVMLMKLEDPKYFPYWSPDIGNHITIGKFKISTIVSYKASYYVHTVLLIINQEITELRLIHHYCYQEWPNYSVPTNFECFLNFLNVISEKRKLLCPKTTSCDPIIVHCSAGVGRTGTFCAIMNAIKSIEQTGTVNLFEIVKKVRINRPLSVVVQNQYLFCYQILVHYVTSMPQFNI